MKERIVLIGAGAIGGVTAAFIAKAGYDITLVCKHQSTANLANGKGLFVDGVKGSFYSAVNTVAAIEELKGQFDIVLIATKAYDMPAVARGIKPYIYEHSLVVSMQNGICTEEIANIIGQEHTVGCVIGWGSTMNSPANYTITSTGDFLIGHIDGDNARLEKLQKIFSTAFNTIIVDDIFQQLYSKLIINSCITSLGAISGLKLGEMLKHKQARKIFIAIITEAITLGNEMDIFVPPYGNKLDYYKLIKGKSLISKIKRHLTILFIGFKYRRLKSSSLQSLERGNPTEVKYLNGFIVDKCSQYNVACPINTRLVEMITEIEGKKRSIKYENLSDSKLMQLL